MAQRYEKEAIDLRCQIYDIRFNRVFFEILNPKSYILNRIGPRRPPE
jgi:hypothetical protein